MDIVRGLQPAISKFNDLEQKLIKEVINNINHSDYFRDKITAVEIEDNIKEVTEYYKENRIRLFINPHIIDYVGLKPQMDKFCSYTIGVSWKSQICNKDLNEHDITYTKHLMELNECSDPMPRPDKLKSFIKSTAEQDEILKKVNEAFVKGKIMPNKNGCKIAGHDPLLGYKPLLLEDFKYYSSKNLYELAKDYFVIIKELKTDQNIHIKDTYDLIICREFRTNTLQERHLPNGKRGFFLTINTETSEITNLQYEYNFIVIL